MFLFAFFGFWGTLGVAGGAVLIPVIIHLINRKRFKIVPWAAMKFLLAAQKQTRKRMRIEQLLLLLCRMAILGLIVFAMASVMPWAEDIWAMTPLPALGKAKRPGNLRTHHIFVLDASLSMNQKADGDQTAFEVAKAQMLRKLGDNNSGDGYSVLVLKDSPMWLVGEASQDPRKVIREVEKVRLSHGNASVQTALNMVSSKITEAEPRFARQAVYFFTDMQSATWAGTGAADFKGDTEGGQKSAYLEIEEKKATTVFVDCGPARDQGNLSVRDVEFDLSFLPYMTTGLDFTLKATVRNHGAEPKSVRPELLIGKAKDGPNDAALDLRVTASRTEAITIDPGAGHIFLFRDVRFDKPGTYAVQVKLPDDALTQDNTRTIILTVRDKIPVLLVNGKHSIERFGGATDFLKFALNPFPPGNLERWLPIQPEVRTPQDFKEMNDAALEKYDCIFWCDVADFGDIEMRKLDTHVRRGGGLIISVGKESAGALGKYEQHFYKEGRGLMPARLLKSIAAPAEHSFYLQNTDLAAFDLPPLRAFSYERDQATLRSVRFREYVQAEVKEGRARTVLSFATEYTVNDQVKRDPDLPSSAPAIIEWNPPLSRAQQFTDAKQGRRADRFRAQYRGKVILVTSALNRDWSNWPGSPSFAAMMHELNKLALSGRLREQSAVVGGVLDGTLPGGAEAEVAIKYPAEVNVKPGKVRSQAIEEVNVFRWADTDFAGVYRAETGGHEIPFAVNVPTSTGDQKGSESDLGRLDAQALKVGYPGWTVQVVRDALEAMLSGSGVNPNASETPLPVGPWLANIALLIVLALLFLEIVLAWHFGHYTTTEGAVAQAAPSPTVTGIAGVVAVLSVIVVGLTGFVLWHERQYGDFLGFLPDLLRDWFELVMGIEPPAAGEGRNWPLGKQEFLFGMPGPEFWYAVLIGLGALAAIFFTYRAEAPRVSLGFKLLLGTLRFCLILATLWFLLPRLQIEYERKGYPDLVLLIDDTRSMGEPDTFQDKAVKEKVEKLSASIRASLQRDIPERISALEAEIRAKKAAAEKDAELKADMKVEIESLEQRLSYWTRQDEALKKGTWRPSRLQLVQAILAQPEPHWLKTLLQKHKTKIHVFHLDVNGRAVKLRDAKGDAGEIIDTRSIDRAAVAIARLGPVGEESRLGTSVKQVIDHYRGSGLSSVIMFTDGVTTRDETLAQAADYASQRGVSLFFVGVGDEYPQRDLKLHDLEVDDPIYKDDNAVFQIRVTGHGYKDLTVPIALKLRDKKGKENVIKRELVKIDPNGKSIKVILRDKPTEVGQHPYIIEIEPPKLEPGEKPLPQGDLRVEKTIEVIDMKEIKVLYVESQPRYEFRYLKFLLERESVDPKTKKPMDIRVLLLEAEDGWGGDEEEKRVDAKALKNFPPSLTELNKYDVLIMGDVDPMHKKIKDRLKDIAAYVKGEDGKGGKGAKNGGGILFIAGSAHNPHAYKGTPLADVLPVEPSQATPPPEVPIRDPLRPELTPAGKAHSIFRFGPNEADNQAIWNRMQPMHWHAHKLRANANAEILATHPKLTISNPHPGQEARQPIVVQQLVGTGRSMFFGFDESWRWRKGDDESKYNTFWTQAMRYLSRGRSNRTELRLDKQTPYKVKEKIEVTVRFPENTVGLKSEKKKVEVTVIYLPPGGSERAESEREVIPLTKVEGAWGVYKGYKDRTREGKYRFRLTEPDVSDKKQSVEKPTAEAIVELPPGELDKLRMDYQEMERAAALSNGMFYKLANCDQLLEDLPPGDRFAISPNVPPTLLWNQWWVFAMIVLLITSEWILRKMKHLL